MHLRFKVYICKYTTITSCAQFALDVLHLLMSLSHSCRVTESLGSNEPAGALSATATCFTSLGGKTRFAQKIHKKGGGAKKTIAGLVSSKVLRTGRQWWRLALAGARGRAPVASPAGGIAIAACDRPTHLKNSKPAAPAAGSTTILN